MKHFYANGSVFLVPLRNGGFARGVVARMAPNGKLLLGYFFGPRLQTEGSANLLGLEPGREILITRFGDLGLFKGKWPVIGCLAEWKSSDWPVPSVVRRDPLGRARPILVRYDDDDPSKIVSEEVLAEDNGLPSDGLAGAGFVELKLDKLLG